jgi:dolichyl-phosphate beta-glucosyltransferase
VLHFVIPFYNDASILAENAAAVYAALEHEAAGGFELVLTDDGSTDASRAVATAFAAARPGVRVLGYAPNRGRGYAVRFAALACSGEKLIFSDLDLPQTTRLSHIGLMVERLERDPVVIGSRFLRASATKRRRLRDVVGRAHRLAFRMFLPGLKVNDPDSGFKGFDLAWLKRMCAVSREDRWSWDMEVLAIARTSGLRVVEIPIDWNERHGGYATSVKIVRDGWEEFTGLWRIRRNLGRGLYKL